MADPRRSALFTGTVRHRRHRPTPRAFRYASYHALIDVDELEVLDREVAGFGYNRANLTTFHDRDHLGDLDVPVRTKLAAWLRGQGVTLPDGRVEVLTNLRVLGHVFNPVSWWFCHERDGELAFVVAEVRNTFGDVQRYFLDLRAGRGSSVTSETAKTLHVSPFLPVDGLRYRFTLVPPGDRVLAHVAVDDDDGLVLDATQTGHRRPLTSTSLAATLARYPLMPLRTVVLIHLQALVLWWRRVPFHRRPEPPDAGDADLRQRLGVPGRTEEHAR